jgi:hypothetical protein
MATEHLSTKNKERGVSHWTNPQVQDLINILRAIRATGNLLNLVEDPSELDEDTLVDLGRHLEDLATEGLVICGYENSKEKPEPQAAGQGGA